MPLPPTMVYPIQSPRFEVTRAYVSEFWLALYSTVTYVQTDNVFYMTSPVYPDYQGWIVMNPNFWQWSSNHYTLDHMVQYAYKKDTPSSPEESIGIRILYYYDRDLGRKAIYVSTVPPEVNYKLLLPEATRPYWCPNGEGVVP